MIIEIGRQIAARTRGCAYHMKIGIGSDDAGFELKNIIDTYVQELGHTVIDFGPLTTDPTDYPDVALAVASAVQDESIERGILICGTGIGMCITANKVSGVWAALAHDTYSAERARKSNNAQVITLGARVVGPELAKSIIKTFLESDFQGGNSTRKVAKIASYEGRTFPL